MARMKLADVDRRVLGVLPMDLGAGRWLTPADIGRAGRDRPSRGPELPCAAPGPHALIARSPARLTVCD
jgi:hypothetical protein